MLAGFGVWGWSCKVCEGQGLGSQNCVPERNGRQRGDPSASFLQAAVGHPPLPAEDSVKERFGHSELLVEDETTLKGVLEWQGSTVWER